MTGFQSDPLDHCTLEGALLRLSDQHPHRFTNPGIPLHRNPGISARASKAFLFDEHFLDCSAPAPTLLRGDSLDQRKTLLMPFFNELLGETFQLGSRRSRPSRILENKPKIEPDLLNQRERLAEVGI